MGLWGKAYICAFFLSIPLSLYPFISLSLFLSFFFFFFSSFPFFFLFLVGGGGGRNWTFGKDFAFGKDKLLENIGIWGRVSFGSEWACGSVVVYQCH